MGLMDIGLNPGCHGIPERCFKIKGEPMKICARCFGSTIGHCLSFAVLLFGKLPPWYVSVLLLFPLAVDWSIQHFFKIMSTNNRRLVTGLLGGFGVGAILWSTIFMFAKAGWSFLISQKVVLTWL